VVEVLRVTENLWLEAVKSISATTVVRKKRARFLMAKAPFLDILEFWVG
jgi:hypothetical protein